MTYRFIIFLTQCIVHCNSTTLSWLCTTIAVSKTEFLAVIHLITSLYSSEASASVVHNGIYYPPMSFCQPQSAWLGKGCTIKPQISFISSWTREKESQTSEFWRSKIIVGDCCSPLFAVMLLTSYPCMQWMVDFVVGIRLYAPKILIGQNTQICSAAGSQFLHSKCEGSALDEVHHWHQWTKHIVMC